MIGRSAIKFSGKKKAVLFCFECGVVYLADFHFAESKRPIAIGLELFGNVGEVKVSATVASYLEDHLALIATETEPEVTPPISDNVILQLVGAPKLVPDAQTLFNHPSNKGKLSPYVRSVIIIINPEKSRIINSIF